MELVSIEDIRRAATTVAEVAVRTPLLPAEWASGPGALWLKPENLQTIGAFKIRGAYNAISSLPATMRNAGVITYSSGNHAQAVAYTARRRGVRCTVVMPEDALPLKIEATKALGAEIVLVPAAHRKTHAEELAAQHGYAIIPPFDHPEIIAGQGTIGLEIIVDLSTVDVVLVPVGGGGLASGVATAIKALRPTATVIGVEPELAADAAESLRNRALTTWPVSMTGRTIADGLRTNLSELTFAHLLRYLDDIITVSEEQILTTVAQLARSAHLVAEPSGAVSVAGYLYHRDKLPIGQTVAVISGGNIDPKLLAEVIS